MEHSPPEAYSRSASQEIPRLLWNAKVHYRDHKGPPLDPTCLNESSLYRHASHLISVRRIRLPSGLFPSAFPQGQQNVRYSWDH
jgi:hypothetical protein